ncbi:MAG: TCR/Tet family MFS transporter [Hyphomonadaceae bacterium]|nr:TCR/Tet family MFS transporter [Hyphomonadaceae bacterium]
MTDSAPSVAADERRAIALIFTAVLIDSIGFGIIIPVLPTYLSTLADVPLQEATRIAGWLMVVFAVLQFLCGPLLGNLSDQFGRRPVLLLSMAGFGLNYLLMGLAPDLVWLFIGRALAGVAGAIYAPANAYMADISPPEKRAQRFGMLGAAFGLGFILGPALGGLIGSIDARAPFFLAAALAFANAGIGYFVLRESLPIERRRAFDWRRANPLGAFRALARHPTVIGVAFAIFLWQLAFHVYPSTWSFFAALKFGWGEAMIGLSLASSGLLMAIVQGGMTGRIVRAFGERRAAFYGFASFISACLLYTIIPYGWMAFLVQPIAAGQGVGGAAMQAIASQRTSAEEQGELQGGIASLNGLGAIVGPLAMTQTLAWFSEPTRGAPFYGAAFLLAAALALAAAAIFERTTRSDRSMALPRRAPPV